jgi:hypothetical protein
MWAVRATKVGRHRPWPGTALPRGCAHTLLTRLGAALDGVDPGTDPWDEHPDDVLKRVRQER